MPRQAISGDAACGDRQVAVTGLAESHGRMLKASHGHM